MPKIGTDPPIAKSRWLTVLLMMLHDLNGTRKETSSS